MLLPFTVIAAIASVGAIPSNHHFHWQGRIPAGQSIEINSVYGSIHAEPACGDRAEVLAYRAGKAIDPSEVRVEMVQNPGGVTFIAHYPDSPLDPTAMPAGAARIDFTVRVPKGVRFIGRTVNGSVEARSLRSDAAAYTVNGNVLMSTEGEAQAETVNGSITATLGHAGAHKSLKFSTVNGAITLKVPAGVNASVHAKTKHGGISTDFRLPVTNQLAGGTVNGRLGKGGPELNVNTINGDIHLRRWCNMAL